jgi:hypothetical protein
VSWSSGALTYAVLRTVLGVALVLVAAAGTRRAWPVVGQAVADAACTAFMLAYVDLDLRESLGWLAAPLVAYVIAWEGWGAFHEAAAADDTPWDGMQPDLLAWFGGIWRLLYRILFLTPPVVAGGFLVLALLYPGGWIFPEMPAPLRCAPDTLARGDTLTLRMVAPHGAQLGVFTPSRGFLYIVDYGPRTAPTEQRFESRGRFSLAADRATGRVLEGAPPGYPEVPIFTDTGTYRFRVSDASEISPSLMCNVRYVGERPLRPRGP